MSLDLDQLEAEAKADLKLHSDPYSGDPLWIKAVLTLISELRSEQSQSNSYEIFKEIVNKQVSLMKERLESAEAALKFYSEPDSWQSTTHDSTFDGMPCTDFQSFKSLAVGSHQVAGKIARAHFEKYSDDRGKSVCRHGTDTENKCELCE